MQQFQSNLSALQSRTGGFLTDLRVLDIGCAQAIALMSRFDLNSFSDAAFDELGIDRPHSLDKAVEKRRAEFLAGRTVAQAALSALGRGAEQIRVGTNREPIWPEGIAGSIAHSSTRCAAVISDRADMMIGVDIEDVARAAALDSIFQVTLLTDETRLIRKQDVMPAAVLATLVFSAKETLYKALFPKVRRFFGFDHAELIAPPDAYGLKLRLIQRLDARFCEGREFEIGYKILADTVITWLVTPDLVERG